MKNLRRRISFEGKGMSWSFFGLFCLLWTACQTGPKVSQGAEGVKLAETIHELRSCTSLGLYTVTGEASHVGGPDDAVEVRAREQGKEMKATHVFMKEKGSKSRVYEAFRCK